MIECNFLVYLKESLPCGMYKDKNVIEVNKYYWPCPNMVNVTTVFKDDLRIPIANILAIEVVKV